MIYQYISVSLHNLHFEVCQFTNKYIMINTIKKTKKSSNARPTTSDQGKQKTTRLAKETKKIISEEDIRRRAFEIYQENGQQSSNDLDNWFYAKRELEGYYR